jgi:hypothetical protein
MQSDPFMAWLVARGSCAKHVSADIESRCRRVERSLSIDLDEELSQGRASSVIARLWTESERYLKPGSNPKTSVDVLVRAVKRYHLFLVDTGVLPRA